VSEALTCCWEGVGNEIFCTVQMYEILPGYRDEL